MRFLPVSLLLFTATVGARAPSMEAQAPRPTMTIEEYEPRSTLVVPAHPKPRAKFPFIDVHGHQPTAPSEAGLDKLIREMDQLNMRVMVNLSGRQGATLAEGVKNYAR